MSESSASRSLTPALSPAAISVIGQTQVDTYTVALYHLDSQVGNLVPDATGNYTATLVNNAVVTSTGLYGGALYLNGNAAYLKTGDLGVLPRGTIEAFVDFSQTCVSGVSSTFSVFSAGGDYHSNQRSMSVRSNGYLDFQIFRSSQWLMASSGINPCRYLDGAPGNGATYWPYETWRFHHVAATWGERGTEIWVDGVLHGVGTTWNIPAHTPVPAGSVTPLVYASDAYWCNPQAQGGLLYSPAYTPNPLYPVCQTPIIAPPYPTGDYTGTLPAYTNFLIGCDADSDLSILCFRGRIDEVRISNIQRQFTWAVVPTSTPTPTQTPDLVTGEYSVDANTIMLHHFNSQSGGYVSDSVQGNKAGYLSGSSSITPTGKYNSGLYLNGAPSLVSIPALAFVLPQQGAVEVWVRLVGGSNPVFLHEGGPYGNYWDQLTLGSGVNSSHPNIGFGLQNPQISQSWYWVDSGISPAAMMGAWHHVAGTWGNRGMEIWIDGHLCGVNAAITLLPYGVNQPFLVGCDGLAHCVLGTMDELRISSTQRSYVLSPGAQPRALAPSDPLPYQSFFPLILSVLPSPTSVPLCGG